MRYFARVSNDGKFMYLLRFEVTEEAVREAVWRTDTGEWGDSEHSIAKALVTGSMEYEEIPEATARAFRPAAFASAS